ncbi:MAG: fasciclin domain-containing protein [Balneolaceae bacterium]|nr:fasciclin domain-containing protein [Balneolaceae bacterium]
MKFISYNFLLIITTITILAISCSPKDQNTADSSAMNTSNHGQAGVVDEDSKANILQIAKSSDDHTTLAAAIEAAGIQNVLVNAGPLTVFAPHNAAFHALPEGTVEDLLKPENKQKLAKILTSHASPANIKEHQLRDGLNVYLATGQYVQVTEENGEFYINGAKILGSVEASNGMIHIIDQVFLFPEG